MKQIILIKEEIKNDMSQEYQQLLKGLKKSEIIDIINNLESKNVELPEDYKSPSTSLKKESLIDVAISIIKANESSEGWNNVLKETPYLDALVDSEDEEKEDEEENKEEDAEENEEDAEEEEGEEGEEEEGEECDDCDCCSFTYEPTFKERVQWKIYDFRWELLLLNDNIKTFCTSVNGLFKISTTAELLTLFIFVIKFQNSLTFSPYFVERISNQNTLILLKYLEILGYYIGIFIATPLVVSYYFNFLPEPIEEDDEDEEDAEYDDDDDLYASDSEEEYDHLVAPEDEESEEESEEEEEEEVNEIPEKEASQEGEDVNELLVNGDEDVYDYEDLDSDYLIDSDVEDDYDYEEYPNLTLVDENEKDSFDPFTYSLAKIAVAYICYRYGTGLCDFNDLVINSNLYEVTIGFGIIGALIGLYN